MKKAIAKFLRVTRARHHLTQQKLSDKVKFKRVNYARMESKGVISGEDLLNYLDALDLKPSALDEFFLERKREKEREYHVNMAREIVGNDLEIERVTEDELTQFRNHFKAY
jgi:transcriptional regulator with XRE-family HTH domain